MGWTQGWPVCLEEGESNCTAFSTHSAYAYANLCGHRNAHTCHRWPTATPEELEITLPATSTTPANELDSCKWFWLNQTGMAAYFIDRTPTTFQIILVTLMPKTSGPRQTRKIIMLEIQLTPQAWKTWTWMSCPCLEICWGQAQPSWTGTGCAVRAAVRAGWARWPWTARTATGQVCPRTPAVAPSAGRPAPMTSAFSPRKETIFWGMLLPGGTGASVSPAMGPYPPCGRAITQACLELYPGKADGEVSGSKFWNSSLAFIVR